MQKDGPVLIMTIICLMMIGGLIVFGLVENARYSGFEQAALDGKNAAHVIETSRVN